MNNIENINEEIIATAPAIVEELIINPEIIATAPTIVIEEKLPPSIIIEENIVPPSRGRRSAVPTMYQLEVGQCMVCPPGIPKRPHQTVYYHNALAKKKGTGKVWGVSCRNGVYRIHRLK
jgi:hypothetical protein